MSIAHIYVAQTCRQMSSHTHMHAVKLLSAMVDDSTFTLFRCHRTLLWSYDRDGMAQTKCQKETTERLAKYMSVSKLATNLAGDKL